MPAKKESKVNMALLIKFNISRGKMTQCLAGQIYLLMCAEIYVAKLELDKFKHGCHASKRKRKRNRILEGEPQGGKEIRRSAEMGTKPISCPKTNRAFCRSQPTKQFAQA